MEFSAVVRKRFMCRRYLPRDLPPEALDRILDLGVRFPSAGHTQPQEFIVVRDAAVKARLAEAALGQEYVAQAPVVIAVVSDTRRPEPRYGERGVKFYSVIDGAFASMLLLLAAVNEGLGACFVAAFDDQAVSRVLGLPPAVRPIGLITIGVCAEGPRKASRRKQETIVHHERW